MRTQEIKIYKFSYLSDSSKENALNKYNENNEYFWGNDGIKSLEGFLKHFDCKLKNYSIDWSGCSSKNTYSIDWNENELTEQELKQLIDSLGSYNPETLKGLGDCKFTGYCMDEELADGARIEYFKGERNLENIINAGIAEWEQATQKDYEYLQSE